MYSTIRTSSSLVNTDQNILFADAFRLYTFKTYFFDILTVCYTFIHFL